MTLVRLEPAAPQSRVKHSTTEPLRSLIYLLTLWTDVSVKANSVNPVKTALMKYCISLKIDFVVANSADPDEMSHYAAFHLGLHCLPKYLFRSFRSTKG